MLNVETKEAAHRRFYDAFHAWFMQSGCDFWSECDAPEELATIAIEISDAFAQAVIKAREPTARYRHHKRGTVYRLIGYAEVQAPEHAPLIEGEVVVVYRAEHNGELWVRRKPEFEDGRFECIEDAKCR